MTTVIDASAVVDLLLRTRSATRIEGHLAASDSHLATVVHLDAEVLSALARLHRAGDVAADDVRQALADLAAFPMRRLPLSGELLAAAWSHRDNVSLKDALYVAAAEALGARLLTTDARLARSVPDLAVRL